MSVSLPRLIDETMRSQWRRRGAGVDGGSVREQAVEEPHLVPHDDGADKLVHEEDAVAPEGDRGMDPLGGEDRNVPGVQLEGGGRVGGIEDAAVRPYLEELEGHKARSRGRLRGGVGGVVREVEGR